MAEEKEKTVKTFTVKIIPSQGDNVTSFTISAGLVNYAVASLVAMIVLVVAAFPFAAYFALNDMGKSEAIQDLRQANEAQQEQILLLMKQAEEIEEELDELELMENELRLLAYGSNGPMTDITVPSSTSVQGAQGGATYQPSLKDMNRLLKELKDKADKRRRSISELREVLKGRGMTVEYQDALINGNPVGFPADGEISSPYGMRWGGSDFHPGVDIADDYGTPIFATAPGVVIFAGWHDGGYGYMVEIEHPNGMTTLYAHAEEVVVRAGQEVKRGQLIALMGSTGFSTGPHVHYEITIGGERVNPNTFF